MSARILEELKRPKMLLLVAATGGLLLFKRVGPKEVTFRHSVSACASSVEVRAFQGKEKVRSSVLAVRGSWLEHSFLLPEGQYHLEIFVECKAGPAGGLERTLMLDQDGIIEFDLTDECAC